MNDLTIVVFSFSGHQYLLEWCLRSIYRNAPPHQEIVLVWDDNVDWYPIDFEKIRNNTDVDFRLVKQSEIVSWPASIKHWGWIKQQLAKLYCWKYINSKFVWIVDGDVLLTGNAELFDSARPVLRFDAERSVPDDYKYFMSCFLGIHEYHHCTFVGSTCVFENKICQEIDKKCKTMNGGDLIKIVDQMLISQNHPELPFSEFEIYGHTVYHSDASVVLKPKNWNYVFGEHDWTQPIQVAWARHDQNLEKRYQRLMNQHNPEVD